MIQLPECKVIDMTASWSTFCQSLSIEMISLFKFAHLLLHLSKGSEHWYSWSHALILTFSKIKMHYYSMMVSNNLLPIQHNTMSLLPPFSTVVLLSYISVSLTHCCQASILSDRPENETNYTYVRHPIPTSQKLGGKKLFLLLNHTSSHILTFTKLLVFTSSTVRNTITLAGPSNARIFTRA